MLDLFSDGLKLFIQIAQVVALIYAGYKFTKKPHDSLEEKQSTLEKHVVEQDLKIKEMQKSLDASHEKHRQQDETNATFKSVMLAFVNFEIAYCRNTGYKDNQDLLDAKKELSEYLTGRKHYEKE